MADYSWGETPARLIWYGLSLNEDPFTFFGAVTLLDNTVFAKANGFPNCYWGWGPEDRELGFRCRMLGFEIDRRDGTYIPLKHAQAGFLSEGVWTEEARRTNELYKKRQPRLAEFAAEDGISALKFDLIKKKPLANGNGQSLSNVWHYLVELGTPTP